MSPNRILVVVGAALLGATPAFAQAPTSSPGTSGGAQEQSATTGQTGAAGQSGAMQEVSDAQLEQYARALNDIATFDPDVAVVVRRGDTVEVTAVDRMTQPEVDQALQKAGLSKQEFKQITEQIHQDQQLRQRYGQVVQEMSPQSGAGGTASGASGQPPSGSMGQQPSGQSSGASPSASPK